MPPTAKGPIAAIPMVIHGKDGVDDFGAVFKPPPTPLSPGTQFFCISLMILTTLWTRIDPCREWASPLQGSRMKFGKHGA
jgi:hypothetical protein